MTRRLARVGGGKRQRSGASTARSPGRCSSPLADPPTKTYVVVDQLSVTGLAEEIRMVGGWLRQNNNNLNISGEGRSVLLLDLLRRGLLAFPSGELSLCRCSQLNGRQDHRVVPRHQEPSLGLRTGFTGERLRSVSKRRVIRDGQALHVTPQGGPVPVDPVFRLLSRRLPLLRVLDLVPDLVLLDLFQSYLLG